MADFTVTVADPESGRTYQRDVDGQDANRFAGLTVGDDVDGAAVGLDGYRLTITGGSDTSGRPMHEDVSGPGVKEILSDGGTGFNPERDGVRRRVTVRGNEISDEVHQINARIAERGDEDPEDLFDDEE
ncbi:30S ribosomal protein S6e [Halococcoides cellulosivorans]|uniref:Small ribosomal subunit protein eS6 n=1 Tax=Halococcoides cellulosivorans TaxID=1679096 RepID=A0A2R4X4F9_9EURY|nr:30S ribosomal protein S6e [Halococcoides cellulosivorans]AWB28679.1 30S ribosomal protein S6e [Halococcoides cellulosivorans]